MKHFAGIERKSEHIYANVYSKADSANEELKIPLFVLPPAKPTYNGKVEKEENSRNL